MSFTNSLVRVFFKFYHYLNHKSVFLTFLGLYLFQTVHEGPQHLGYCNAAIGILIVFQDRYQDPWGGDRSVVEGMAIRSLVV